MAKTAACPSCGAPVTFKSAGSIFAVCEFCQSTLVRHDQALEDIGKMAALVEDRSPLQIGAEGNWHGLHFAIIGRIQLQYSQGVWNEWHLMFDDMRTGWLSESAGEYVLSFLKFAAEPLPAFDTIEVGTRLTLASQNWQVTNIEDAECIAGQGELPFKVGAGYAAPVVDLRSGDNFATLDYSESPPLLFIGSPVKFESLKMNNLREGQAIPEINVQAQAFRCPGCGSPMSTRSIDIKSAGCLSCGAVVDTSDTNYQLLSKALEPTDPRFSPRLALGSTGVLEGRPVEIIGFLVKQTSSDDIAYYWSEYLLAGENGTYRWLTAYDGHWNVVDVLSNHPRTGELVEQFSHGGREYKHFSTCEAEVVQVAGEFTWRVARGDTAEVADFISPPFLLSRERTDSEISWSQCRYAEPAEIATAFKLMVPLPDPIGVYANQPSPWDEKHRRTFAHFWKMALLALLVQLVIVFGFGGKTLLRQNLVFNPSNTEETVTTSSFEITGRPKRVVVKNDASINNAWIVLNMALVDKKTGAAISASRELSFYHGIDDGESWSEGSREDEVTFTHVPAGTYALVVDPDFPPENKSPVRTAIEIKISSPSWLNYALVTIFLAIFPIISFLRRSAFETRRWSESEHAPVDDEDE